MAKAVEYPAIAAANTNFRVSAPRLYAQVDRDRAKALGVPISEVFDTMQAYFGNLYINDFVKFGRIYRVQTEALPEYRSRPDDISKIYVRAQNGTAHTMIPLDSVVPPNSAAGRTRLRISMDSILPSCWAVPRLDTAQDKRWTRWNKQRMKS